MRLLVPIGTVIIFVALLASGCKEEVKAPEAAKPPPDPGWPTLALQDAVVSFDLEEAHYHMRKGRYMAPDTYGSAYEMPAAMGYAQWAYAMQVDNDAAMSTADHLVLEQGSAFDAPYGGVAKCKWCGYRMPSALTHWPMENGEKVVECPRCGARNSFPQGLVVTCPNCHETAAGTAAAGPRCPTCGHNWRGLRKACPNCGLEISTLTQGSRCKRCGTNWNSTIPWGKWPVKASAPVQFTGEKTGQKGERQCEAVTAVSGYRCPNMTRRPPDEDGKVRCWVHRNQGKRDEAAKSAASGAGAGAGGAPGAAPGGGGPAGGMGAPGGGMGMPGGGMGAPGGGMGAPGGGMGMPGGGMGPPGGGMGAPGGGAKGGAGAGAAGKGAAGGGLGARRGGEVGEE